MAVTPHDIRKTAFATRMRGYDPQAVDEMMELVAEELTARLTDVARLEHQLNETRARLEKARARQEELQETVLSAQKLAKEMTESAQREAQLLVREAQLTADQIVGQAIEQAQRIETRIGDLRARRRELQLHLGATLERFRSFLEADVVDDREHATIRTLPRRSSGTEAG